MTRSVGRQKDDQSKQNENVRFPFLYLIDSIVLIFININQTQMFFVCPIRFRWESSTNRIEQLTPRDKKTGAVLCEFNDHRVSKKDFRTDSTTTNHSFNKENYEQIGLIFALKE